MAILLSKLFLILALFPNAMVAGTAGGQDPLVFPLQAKGIVVESLEAHGEAYKAGIRVGDILLSWVGPTKRGEMDSPFDLPYVGFEQQALGIVRIQGLRDREKRAWLLRKVPWSIQTRPNLTGSALSSYLEAEELARSRNLSQATKVWRTCATRAKSAGVPWLSAWFLAHAAEALIQAKQTEAGDELYGESVQTAADSGPVVRGELFRRWAVGFVRREESASAEKYYRQELSEWKQLGAELLAARTLNELGGLLLTKGSFSEAESCLLESLVISERLAPTSIQAATSYANLALVYQDQGDLGRAEKHYRLALAIMQKRFPDTFYLALLLRDLGVLSRWRGNLNAAEEYDQQALKILAKLKFPLYIADILDDISDCRRDRGDLAGAMVYQQRALAKREKNGASLAVGASLGGMGKIARLQGKLAAAEDYYRRALETVAAISPTPPQKATYLAGLADVFRDRGSFEKAEQEYREALALMEQSAPRSVDHGETLASIAATLQKEGRLHEAEESFRRALDDLEYQTASVGTVTEMGARYRAKHGAYYREFIDLLIEEGQTNLAFETLEGSRARTLFEMLRLAQVNIHEGADAVLLAHERELRQSLNAKSQYRIRLLNQRHTDEQMDGLDREIAGLGERYQQVEADIRTSSPKYAALTQPQPFSLKEIQGLLDPATVVLEYSLGEKRSHVWVVGEDSLDMRELPGRAVIEPVARQFYQAVTARTHKVSTDPKLEAERWTEADAVAQKLGTRLSRMVLTPVSALIRGKRLLIVSDGALEYVPFSALPAPHEPNVPLLVKHEIVRLPSASVLGEIRRATAGRPRPTREVAVLADPVFDAKDERVIASGRASRMAVSPLSQPARRSAADARVVRRGGFYLERLIYSRDEAETIRALAPRSKTFMALDFDANRAKAISPELTRYRVIHFATHGLLDSNHPELSGLVLSLVDRRGKPQEGFLALEDIYNLKLPADLIVLSSCQTALGEKINGEGLMGLTRGFMYAGASRVIASLWSVDDYTTSELMADFYRALEVEKLRPATALRKAQLEIWKHTGWQAPYYWAAFELQGEWK